MCSARNGVFVEHTKTEYVRRNLHYTEHALRKGEESREERNNHKEEPWLGEEGLLRIPLHDAGSELTLDIEPK